MNRLAGGTGQPALAKPDSRTVTLTPSAVLLKMSSSRARIVCALLISAACAKTEQGAASDSTSAQSLSQPAVEILSPAEGDSVSLPLTIRLGATGVLVVPATGAVEAGKGHHHLVIDVDAAADSLPVPQPPGAIHLGDGTAERVIDALAPGSHRVIAIFAGGDHVPMNAVRRDTVTFIVR